MENIKSRIVTNICQIWIEESVNHSEVQIRDLLTLMRGSSYIIVWYFVCSQLTIVDCEIFLCVIQNH